MSGEKSVAQNDETRPTTANGDTNGQLISIDRWLVILLGVVAAAAFFLPTESGVESGSDLPRIVLIMLLGAGVFWSFHQRTRDKVAVCKSDIEEVIGPNWIDVAVIGFLLLHTASVVVCVSTGRCEPRPAINMLWQQLSFGVLYGSARLILRRGHSITLWQSVVIASGVMVCLYAWYQFLIGLPALHQSYLDASPQQQIQMLTELGVTDTSPDSRMRQLTESRLFNREPFGFFALANSLAGLLVPLILITFAWLWTALLRRNWSELTLWGIAWLFLSSTLALTSSRTGLVTVSLLMAGYVVWQFTKAELSRKVGWLLAIAALILPIGLAVVLWVTGVSDGRLLSSAPATLRYRLEYWLSSSRMIQDYPWLGCGPGSFQSCYAKYQLPSASETISDPHNFVIEWMATAGLPAGLFILTAIAGVVLGLLRLNRTRQEVDVVKEHKEQQHSHWLGSSAAVAMAPVIGVIAGWLFGFIPENHLFLFVGLFVGLVWFTIALVIQTTDKKRSLHSPQQETAPRSAAFHGTVLAWLGLMLHLSASGGINYGAIGQFFFVLMAVIVSRVPAFKIVVPHRLVASVLAALFLMSAGYLYYFQLSPSVKSSSLMSRLAESHRMGRADRLLKQVLTVDRYNSEAAFGLAAVQLKQNLSKLNLVAVQTDTEKTIQSAMVLEPYSSPARADVANQYLMLIDQENTTANRTEVVNYLKQQASHWLEEASERKPTDSRLLAIRSWLFWSQGKADASVEIAQAALALDAKVPHEDLKLNRVTFFVPSAELKSLQNQGYTIEEPPTRSEANRQLSPADQRNSRTLNAKSWCDWVTKQERADAVAPK